MEGLTISSTQYEVYWLTLNKGRGGGEEGRRGGGRLDGSTKSWPMQGRTPGPRTVQGNPGLFRAIQGNTG